MNIVRVALDVPIADSFDFLVPQGVDVPVGTLVVVPFGRSRKVGLAVGSAQTSDIATEKLRPIEGLIEDVPPVPAPELELYRFCANYYQRTLGEVIAASLPPRLRQVSRRPLSPPTASPQAHGFVAQVELTPEQRAALATMGDPGDAFRAILLHGVTGSGKTEVYLHLIAAALDRGRQALLLLPEIALTPQLEAQVRGRFPGACVYAAHSRLNEGERAQAWLAAQSGAAGIVLGTRLAVLTPFRRLGLVIVDEEHDPSYKQQEGLRYSARDLAVWRAQQLAIPVVLGSATPSLESVLNAMSGRYVLARLPTRAGPGAAMPRVRTVDSRADKPKDGLSHALLEALRTRLARGEQSLVFLNRRGFSPVLYCRACSWHSTCTRCSANLVLHKRAGEMRCHHCGRRTRIPTTCPSCGAPELAPIGHGTQRLEDTLRAALPKARIARVDRDTTARRGSLKEVFDSVRAGTLDILVGTQMLAKGHDYPNLTLVGVIDADSALFSADFRAAERLHAQLVQVSGRAGRASQPGEVLIQTDFPHHPLYAAVASHDFDGFAREALAERRLAGFPPFAHLALLRAESKVAGEPATFLREAGRLAQALQAAVEVFDPVAATLERKAGFERAQLLVRATSRAALQPFLGRWREALLERADRRVRWSLDVDPQEV